MWKKYNRPPFHRNRRRLRTAARPPQNETLSVAFARGVSPWRERSRVGMSILQTKTVAKPGEARIQPCGRRRGGVLEP